MSEILSVEDGSNGFYVLIETDMCSIEWRYESAPKCCEKFGIKMSKPTNWLIGKKFKNVTFCDTTLTIHLEETDLRQYLKDLLQRDNEITEKDLTNLDEWTIEFYNKHNGYYCHNLDILIDGKIKWNVSI